MFSIENYQPLVVIFQRQNETRSITTHTHQSIGIDISNLLHSCNFISLEVLFSTICAHFSLAYIFHHNKVAANKKEFCNCNSTFGCVNINK